MAEHATHIRVSDVDRQRVVDSLHQAHAEGRLTLAEFDERTRQAWAAATYGDFAPILADLPPLPSPTPHSAPERARDWRRAPGLRLARDINVGAWAMASLVNFAIWALVSMAVAEPVHPWWVWVAGPWGVVLLTAWVTGVGAGSYRGAPRLGQRGCAASGRRHR